MAETTLDRGAAEAIAGIAAYTGRTAPDVVT